MQKQKRKVRDVIKVAAMSLALVGVFGAALMGANHLAFANAAARTMEVPPFEAMSASQNMPVSTADSISVSIANALSAELAPRRYLNVEETNTTWDWINRDIKNENTIPAEEAAQIGAQYIYEMFGVCVDGATVLMTFNGHLSHRRTAGVWNGVVGDGVDLDKLYQDFDTYDLPILSAGTSLFVFMLNSETGEAIHVERITEFNDGMIILSPHSIEDIESSLFLSPRRIDLNELDEGFRWFSADEIDADGIIRFETFNIWEPDQIPQDLLNIIEDFLNELNLNYGNPHIIRRFTPQAPIIPQTTPQQPQDNEGGNGRDT